MKQALSILTLIVLLLLVAVPASADGGKVHYVQPGETLSSIAVSYGVSAQSIMQANGMLNADYVYVNQKLVIPVGGAGSWTSYTVRQGDTLKSIAAARGTTVQALAEANALGNADFIYAGQSLKVPSVGQSSQWQAPSPPAAMKSGSMGKHVIKPGETLSGIAWKYGISMQALMQANHLSSADWINAGQTLKIPGHKAKSYKAKKKAPRAPKYEEHEPVDAGGACDNPTDVWTHTDQVQVKVVEVWCPWMDFIDDPQGLTTIVLRVRGMENAPVKVQRGNEEPIIIYTGNDPVHGPDYVYYPTAPGYYKVYPDLDKPGQAIEFDLAPGQRAWVDYKLTHATENPRPRNNKGWSGRIVSNPGEITPQNGVSSVIIARGPAGGLPMRIDADGEFTARCYTGQKPELGGTACEFAGLWPGKYYITLEGADVTVEIYVDGQATAEVVFDKL